MSGLSTADYVFVRFGEIEGALFARARTATLQAADGSSLGQVQGTQINNRFAAEFLDAHRGRYCSAQRSDFSRRMFLTPTAWRITGSTDEAIAYLIAGGPPSMERRAKRRIDFRVLPGPPSPDLDDEGVAFVRGGSIETLDEATLTRLHTFPAGWRKDTGWSIEISGQADEWQRRVGIALSWVYCSRLRALSD